MKKVIKIDDLVMNWKFINEEFSKIEYYTLLKKHKFNVKKLDDSYNLDHNNRLSLNFFIKELVYNTLIMKDWPNCYKFKKILIDKGFNNIGLIVYEILTHYELKQIDIFKNLFKNGYLIQEINYLDIRPLYGDSMMECIKSIAILIILLSDDPKFNSNYCSMLIEDFSHMMAVAYATHGSRYDDEMDKKILEILVESDKKF